MFNEQDRRCATVHLMLSTDPNYDKRTIASTLIATNNRDVPRVMKTKFPATVMVFGVPFKWGPHHATSHLRSRLESQHQSVRGCAEEWGDPLVQSGGRWQTLGVAAGLGAGPQVQRDPTQAWLQKECYDFVPFSHWLPSSPNLNPLDYFVWSYIENITNMTSHNTKASLIAAIRRRLWKRHAPGSRSISRQWLRLKAATLSKCQLYCIIKLPELIFSIKVLK